MNRTGLTDIGTMCAIPCNLAFGSPKMIPFLFCRYCWELQKASISLTHRYASMWFQAKRSKESELYGIFVAMIISPSGIMLRLCWKSKTVANGHTHQAPYLRSTPLTH